jgi:hypothetical protein
MVRQWQAELAKGRLVDSMSGALHREYDPVLVEPTPARFGELLTALRGKERSWPNTPPVRGRRAKGRAEIRA